MVDDPLTDAVEYVPAACDSINTTKYAAPCFPLVAETQGSFWFARIRYV